MCLEVYGTSGAHMKNKKGLEAAFALLLLKFVLTCYFASTVCLTKCDRRPFCNAGEGPGRGEHHQRDSSPPIFLPGSPDSSVALKLGRTPALRRAAEMLPGEKQRLLKSCFPAVTSPHAGGSTGPWILVQNCTGKGVARSL